MITDIGFRTIMNLYWVVQRVVNVQTVRQLKAGVPQGERLHSAYQQTSENG